MMMMMDAKEIAEEMKSMDVWDDELCEELCELAGLEDEWKAADGETFESVVFKAADLLGVEIQ